MPPRTPRRAPTWSMLNKHRSFWLAVAVVIVLLFFICVYSIYQASHPSTKSTVQPVLGNAVHLHLKSYPQAGFFSSMYTLLGALQWYETRQHDVDAIKVDYDDNSPYHDAKHGMNWFNALFVPVHVRRNDIPASCVIELINDWHQPNGSMLSPAAVSEYHTTTAYNHELVQRYLTPLPHIQFEIDHFVNHHFVSSEPVIGIHYRGSDKYIEASRVSYSWFVSETRRFVNSHPEWIRCAYFVATDEEEFVAHFTRAMTGQRVITQKLQRTSQHGAPMHDLRNTRGKGYEVSKSAMLDCWLLSRCDGLCRTASNLSAFATVLNPALPVKMITAETA